jgi:thioredoxin 1
VSKPGAIVFTEGVVGSVILITDSEFEAEVLDAQQPVLVYFWASWCGPCRLVSPSIDGIAKNYSDRLKVAKMEIDPNPATVAKYQIEGVPALLLFKNGELAQAHEGAIGKQKIESMLEAHLSPVS